MPEITLSLQDQDEVLRVLGPRDAHLRTLRDALNIRIIPRDRTLLLEGPEPQIQLAERIITQLRSIARQGPITPSDVQLTLETLQRSGDQDSPERLAVETIGKGVRPKTDGQSRYVRMMREKDITICIGPAGTGKTYLATATAAAALKAGQVKKLVLCRPAVEAGERLGFLPGDIEDKVNPYLRPLLDALEDLLPIELVRRYLETNVIELSPLAFMRGRTLNHAYIILDEGQNTTITQMKMFLTRLGAGSRMVITGDVTQVDLPRTIPSGLVDAGHRLKNLDRIGVITLENADIVRHPLVQQIVEAYEGDRSRRTTIG
ncbi:MAG: PhoH family protein [Planctomycetia bacterium]|nr:PhoH family protein [Planctomycetia bacterium]